MASFLQNHRRSHHRPKKRPAPHLVHAGNAQRAAPARRFFELHPQTMGFNAIEFKYKKTVES